MSLLRVAFGLSEDAFEFLQRSLGLADRTSTLDDNNDRLDRLSKVQIHPLKLLPQLRGGRQGGNQSGR